jgi:hypothetical protein
METYVLRRISGSLILAIALGLSTEQAISASGYKKLTPSKSASNDRDDPSPYSQIT